LYFENYPALAIRSYSDLPANNLFITCFPNPSNSSCTFNFRLDNASKVKLEITDMLGNEIAPLLNKSLNDGWQSVTFNTSVLPTGIYFYKLTVDSKSVTKKLIISR
jgi:hypothetical protein